MSYRNFVIVTNEKEYTRHVKSHLLKRAEIYSDSLMVMEMAFDERVIDKPRYLGATVLDLAKLQLYDFHYNHILKTFPGAQLLFTDTDSLCYKITTESHVNPYEKFHQTCNIMDLSNFPLDSPFHNTTNKLIPGYVKDEGGGKQILEFVGLKAKMYSLLTDNTSSTTKQKATAKGLKKNVRSNTLNHYVYKNVFLTDAEADPIEFCTIRSKKQQLYTVTETKRSLNSYNDKRYYLKIFNNSNRPPFVTTHSFGHFVLRRSRS